MPEIFIDFGGFNGNLAIFAAVASHGIKLLLFIGFVYAGNDFRNVRAVAEVIPLREVEYRKNKHSFLQRKRTGGAGSCQARGSSVYEAGTFRALGADLLGEFDGPREKRVLVKILGE